MKKMTAKVDITPVPDGPVGGGFSALFPVSDRSSARRRSAAQTNRESYNDIVSTLFEHNTEVMEELLIKSAKSGDLAQVALILQRRAEVLFSIDAKDPSSGNTALMWAATNGHSKIVQLLLRHGADVTVKNHDGVTAIGLSLPLVRQMLLESVEHGGAHSSLCQAAWQGNVSLIKKLLAHSSVNVNCKNADQLSPILLATRDIHLFEKLGTFASGSNYSPVEVIRELLKHNVDLTAADEDQMTALHYICSSGSQSSNQIVPCLLKAGANPDARDKTESTPLHHASLKGYSDIVVALLNGGADPNAKDFSGRTPLHLTAKLGHDQTTLVLVQHGADIFVADEGGMTPLDLATNKAVKLTLRQAWMSSSRKPDNSDIQHEYSPADCRNDGINEIITSYTNAEQSKEGRIQNSSSKPGAIGNSNYSRHLKNNVVGIQSTDLKGDFQQRASGRIRFGGKGMASRPTPRSPKGQRRAPCRVIHPEKTDEKSEDSQRPGEQQHFLPRLSRNSPVLAATASDQESPRLRNGEDKLLALEDLFPDATDEKPAFSNKPGSAKFPKPNSCPAISQNVGHMSPVGSNQSPRTSEGNCLSPLYIHQLASIFFTDIDRIYKNACQPKEDNTLKVVEIDSSSLEDQHNSTTVDSSSHLKMFKSILREGNFNINDTRVRNSNDSGCPDEGITNSNSTSSSNSNFSSSLDNIDFPTEGRKPTSSKDVTKKAAMSGSGNDPTSSKDLVEVNLAKMPSNPVNASGNLVSSTDIKATQNKFSSRKQVNLTQKELENVDHCQSEVKATIVQVKPPQSGVIIKPVSNSFITSNKNSDLKVKNISQTSVDGASGYTSRTFQPENTLARQPDSLEENTSVFSNDRTGNGRIKNTSNSSKIKEFVKISPHSGSSPLMAAELEQNIVVNSPPNLTTESNSKTSDLTQPELKTKTRTSTRIADLASNTRSLRSASCGPSERIQSSSAQANKASVISKVETSIPKKIMMLHHSNKTSVKPDQVRNDEKSTSAEPQNASTSNNAVILTRNRPSSFHYKSTAVSSQTGKDVTNNCPQVSDLSEKTSKMFIARPILPEKPAVLDEASVGKSYLTSKENPVIPLSLSSPKLSTSNLSAQKQSLSKSVTSSQKHPFSLNQSTTKKSSCAQKNLSETSECQDKGSSLKAERSEISSAQKSSSLPGFDKSLDLSVQNPALGAAKVDGNRNKMPLQSKAVAFMKQIRSSFRNNNQGKVDYLKPNSSNKSAEEQIEEKCKEHYMSINGREKPAIGEDRNRNSESQPENNFNAELPHRETHLTRDNDSRHNQKMTEVNGGGSDGKPVNRFTDRTLVSKPVQVEHTGPIISDAFESLKLRQATAAAAAAKDEHQLEASKSHEMLKSAGKVRCKTATVIRPQMPGKSKRLKTARQFPTSAGTSGLKTKAKSSRKDRSRKRSKKNSADVLTSRSKEDEIPCGPDVKLIGGIGWHVATRSVAVNRDEIYSQEIDCNQEEILEKTCSTSRSTARKSTRSCNVSDIEESEGRPQRGDSYLIGSSRKHRNNIETVNTSKTQPLNLAEPDFKHSDRNLDNEPFSIRISGGKKSHLKKEDPNTATKYSESKIVCSDALLEQFDEGDKEEVTITVLPLTPRDKHSARTEDSDDKFSKNSQVVCSVGQSKFHDGRTTEDEVEVKELFQQSLKVSESSSLRASSRKPKLKSEKKDESFAQKSSSLSSTVRQSHDKTGHTIAEQSLHEITDSRTNEDISQLTSTRQNSPEGIEHDNIFYESIVNAKILKSASSSAIGQSFQGLERSPRFIRKHDSYTLRQRTAVQSNSDNEDSPRDVPAQLSSDVQQQLESSLMSTDQNAKLVTSRLGRCSTYSRSTSSNSRVQAGIDEVETIQWKRGNVLGKGAYGTVWCGLTNSGELIAVKMIELNTSNFEKAEMEYAQIQEEVELLKALKHKNIVGYLGTSLEDNFVSIFMQFVPGGSIASIIARFGSLDEEVFCNYTKQILEGVEYLHANNVIHRDIKGGNIMLMHNGIIKLIDFGCAKKLCFNITTPSADLSPLLKSMRGTPYWMAPEVVREDGHGIQSDIWSIGCTVFEMATKKPPWSEYPPAVAIFTIGCDSKPIPQLPSKFSENACSFVNACLTRDPRKRPSATLLLRHAFVVNRKRPKTSSLS